MKINDALKKITRIQYCVDSHTVVKTASEELQNSTNATVLEISKSKNLEERVGVFSISIADDLLFNDFNYMQTKERIKGEFVFFQIKEDGSGKIVTSKANILFSFVCYLSEHLLDHDIDVFVKGKIFPITFNWQRVTYDYFLTQEGRIQRNLDKESYVRELARLGFTHLEVNGLAYPMGLESGPKGETYPMFYTYCPALDQFVYSELNKGLYPFYYLAANLNNLKENAKLAYKYGLTPGMLCFEPRSVPEEFFQRYPMLRGARVDHPFRSFKPRYNMTITHPKVREHYAEMMEKLMTEVPDLGFISIWTNDSGAGFEYTKSLYVGRNGGAYLIREWKEDEEIARLAGENAIRFFRVLRDTACEINPGFRVITRMESFYGEHDTVWQGLGQGVEVESASLIAKGWDMPYSHPKYPDNKSITAGSVYQHVFDEKEKPFIAELAEKDANAHFYFTAGPHIMFNPLLGIPYPNLTFQKLHSMHSNGVEYLAHTGGGFPPNLVPYNINHEIVRLFQFNPEMNINDEIVKIAIKWADEKFYKELVKAWELTEKAIFAFPNIFPLYSGMGFTWYRLWVRPFVPNLEAISDQDRAFYQDFMCTTPHNPNNVDLSRDVLFQLTTPEKSEINVRRIDQNLWQPMDNAIEILQSIEKEAIGELGENNVITDQLVRLKALRCWFMTQRNVAAWIAGVHGYLNAESASQKRTCRNMIRDMMEKEIENTREVKILLDSNVEFMSVTDKGETPLVYGDNLGELLDKRIELMIEHINDEPYIDPNYIERKAGELF